MVLYVLQLGHRQFHPSLQALVVRVTQFIGTPHVVHAVHATSQYPLALQKIDGSNSVISKNNWS